MSRRLPLSASNPRQPGRMARDRRLWAHDLSSTSALFVAPRTPIFPGFSRMVARLFANPRGPVGFQELKNTSFFQAFLVTRDYKMGRSRATANLQNTIDEVFEFARSRHGEVPLENDPVEAMKGADDEAGELDQEARYCAHGILPRMVATTTNHSLG